MFLAPYVWVCFRFFRVFLPPLLELMGGSNAGFRFQGVELKGFQWTLVMNNPAQDARQKNQILLPICI